MKLFILAAIFATACADSYLRQKRESQAAGSFDASATSYQAPSNSYAAPVPSPSYTVPAASYGAPAPSYSSSSYGYDQSPSAGFFSGLSIRSEMIQTIFVVAAVLIVLSFLGIVSFPALKFGNIVGRFLEDRNLLDDASGIADVVKTVYESLENFEDQLTKDQ